jgi:hypothetical protein
MLAPAWQRRRCASPLTAAQWMMGSSAVRWGAGHLLGACLSPLPRGEKRHSPENQFESSHFWNFRSEVPHPPESYRWRSLCPGYAAARRVVWLSGSTTAQLTAFDDTSAKAMPGVVAVARDGRFLGVVAWREKQAIAARGVIQRAAIWTMPAELPKEAAITTERRRAGCEPWAY